MLFSLSYSLDIFVYGECYLQLVDLKCKIKTKESTTTSVAALLFSIVNHRITLTEQYKIVNKPGMDCSSY